jgi:hypothetical protein
MNQLIAELDGFAEDLARDGAAGVNLVASASQQLARLERENTELRNEIARLNNQTNWVCKCGGTDCEGQRENAALRELTSTLGAPNHINIPVEKWHELRVDKERLDWVIKDSYYHFFFKLSSDLEKGRRQIDAARKEPRT